MKDPRELTNVWNDASYAAVKAELEKGLLDWLVQTSDATPVHVDPRGPPHFPHPASPCAMSGAVGPTAASSLFMGATAEKMVGDLLLDVNVTDFYRESPLSSE